MESLFIRLFFGLFFPWNYFEPIFKLFIKIFTFLTVLSILVSTIELVEAIRALFELFYLNYFKTVLKNVYIFWYVLSILVSTMSSLVWSWMENMMEKDRSRPSGLFLNYLSENDFKTIFKKLFLKHMKRECEYFLVTVFTNSFEIVFRQIVQK